VVAGSGIAAIVSGARSRERRVLPIRLQMTRPRVLLLAVPLVAAAIAAGPPPVGPPPARATTCAAYTNQAAAERAADTRDADSDGIYCESLPCPCLKAGATSPPPPATPTSSCTRPASVVRLRFSAAKYPNIKRHTERAIAEGWPSVMVLNRRGKDERRQRLLHNLPTRSGYDRDEYPAAVGRGRPNGGRRGLVRGAGPIGWRADVMYVPSSENRSHGASLGAKLRRFCEGTRFRYMFG
jgi:hypothetical protein